MKKHIPPFRFHFLTGLYDFFCSLAGLGPGFKKEILKQTKIQNGKSIIDIGCGTGVLTEQAQMLFPDSRIVGIDPDKDALALAQKRAHKISFILSGAEKLPFKEKSFDFAISSLAFHHMPLDVKKHAAQEAYRILKPGGIFYLFDFKPRKKNIFNFWTFVEAEHAGDNYKGKVWTALKEADFRKLTRKMTKYGLLELIEAQKQ